MKRRTYFLTLGIIIGALLALLLSLEPAEAKEVAKEDLIMKPQSVEQYRIQRSQLDRMRRRLLYEMGQSPEWMHDADQVKKVYQTVLMLDTFIMESYLKEQDAREEWAEQQEYLKLKGYKGDTNADSSN